MANVCLYVKKEGNTDVQRESEKIKRNKEVEKRHQGDGLKKRKRERQDSRKILPVLGRRDGSVVKTTSCS